MGERSILSYILGYEKFQELTPYVSRKLSVMPTCLLNNMVYLSNEQPTLDTLTSLGLTDESQLR